MKNTVILVKLVLLAACTPAPTYSGSTGRAVFLVTDAAADMNSVSNVYVTIDRVEMQSASQGWVTVSSSPKTYDLLELDAEGKTAVLADVELQEGSYNQVRMVISDVTVVDADGSHEAKLPSEEMRIVGNVDVDAGQTSTITFDFIADESLHTTGKGEYVMAPVVQVVTRENARVEVDAEGDAAVEGSVRSSTKVGMDIKGNVGVGLSIGRGELLSIDIGGIIRDDCVCTAQYDPVCGSDKRTYSNACHAGCAGVSYSQGVCPTSGMTTVNISSSSSGNVNY